MKVGEEQFHPGLDLLFSFVSCVHLPPNSVLSCIWGHLRVFHAALGRVLRE